MRHFEQELERLQTRLLEMGGLVESAIRRSIHALIHGDAGEAKAVLENEARINQLEMEIDDMAVQLLALQQPMAKDLRLITAAIKIGMDLERMGDLAGSIAQRALLSMKIGPIQPLVDIPRMALLTESMVRKSLDSFVRRDADLAREVLSSDDQVDDLLSFVSGDLLLLMQRNPALVPQAVDLMLTARRLERIADHATNIAEDVVYLITGVDVRHRKSTDAPGVTSSPSSSLV